MSDGWWRVVVTLPDAEGRLDALAALLIAATGSAVEQLDDGSVAGAIRTRPAAESLRAAVGIAFGAARIELTSLPGVDWSTHWRAGLATRRIGRLVLTPSWLTVTPSDGEVVVNIDPESAFGSGEHGSTRGALALLERMVRPGDRMLDLGSGSGVLAIAAVRLGARRAIGIDNDADTIAVAEENARRNGVGDRMGFVAGEAALLAPLVGAADVIAANILRDVNVALLPVVAGALAPSGRAVFAGMELADAPVFTAALDAAGLVSTDTVIDDGWWSVTAARR